MNKIIIGLLAVVSLGIYAADNEIYIDQTGTTFNLDAEQLGSGNIIGGANAAAGSMTALDLDGNVQTIDVKVKCVSISINNPINICITC